MFRERNWVGVLMKETSLCSRETRSRSAVYVDLACVARSGIIPSVWSQTPTTYSTDNLLNDKFYHEFRDLELPGMQIMDVRLQSAAAESRQSCPEQSSLVHTLLDAPLLLRALARARLFAGSISAGGGSCQGTFKGTLVAECQWLQMSVGLGGAAARLLEDIAPVVGRELVSIVGTFAWRWISGCWRHLGNSVSQHVFRPQPH